MAGPRRAGEARRQTLASPARSHGQRGADRARPRASLHSTACTGCTRSPPPPPRPLSRAPLRRPARIAVIMAPTPPPKNPPPVIRHHQNEFTGQPHSPPPAARRPHPACRHTRLRPHSVVGAQAAHEGPRSTRCVAMCTRCAVMARTRTAQRQCSTRERRGGGRMTSRTAARPAVLHRAELQGFLSLDCTATDNVAPTCPALAPPAVVNVFSPPIPPAPSRSAASCASLGCSCSSGPVNRTRLRPHATRLDSASVAAILPLCLHSAAPVRIAAIDALDCVSTPALPATPFSAHRLLYSFAPHGEIAARPASAQTRSDRRRSAHLDRWPATGLERHGLFQFLDGQRCRANRRSHGTAEPAERDAPISVPAAAAAAAGGSASGTLPPERASAFSFGRSVVAVSPGPSSAPAAWFFGRGFRSRLRLLERAYLRSRQQAQLVRWWRSALIVRAVERPSALLVDPVLFFLPAQPPRPAASLDVLHLARTESRAAAGQRRRPVGDGA